MKDLKNLKLSDTSKKILCGLGILVLIIGLAYFYMPTKKSGNIIEGMGAESNGEGVNDSPQSNLTTIEKNNDITTGLNDDNASDMDKLETDGSNESYLYSDNIGRRGKYLDLDSGDIVFRGLDWDRVTTISNELIPSTLMWQELWGDEFKYGGAVEIANQKGKRKGVVKKCKFPFTYKGEKYNNCTKKDSIAPWCATISKFDGEWWKPGKDDQGTWGYCQAAVPYSMVYKKNND